MRRLARAFLALSVSFGAVALRAQPAPAAPMTAEAQAAAMAAQLAVQQQGAAIQQQMQQQVEAGRQQAGKSVASTAPQRKAAQRSTVEELDRAGCGQADRTMACSPGEKAAARRGPVIVPEPGSEMAPPQGSAAASARPGAPGPTNLNSSGDVRGDARHPAAAVGVAAEMAPAPLPMELPISSLPRVPELAATASAAPVEPGKLRPATKKVAAKYDVSRIGDRGVGGGIDFFSLAKEQALGKDLAADVERESRLITDPAIVEYVNRVGQNLVRNSDAKVPFVIKVIDSDEVNAFALPGGYFYVNSGLILAADNEAELAGVMAHEIAHVAARHATKNETRSQILNLASVPLIFLGGPVGYAVRQAMGLAIPMGYMKFSRDMEREADLLGLEYQYATGYDPQEFVRFFETIRAREKQKQSFLAKTFATHPMTAERIKRAQQEIEKYLPPKPDYVVDTSDFQQVKARLVAMQTAARLSGVQSANRPTLRRRDRPSEEGPPKLERKQ